MIESVVYIEVPPGKVGEALGAIERAQGRMQGALQGCWSSEIGRLNRILHIARYGSADALSEDRRQAQAGGDPFGVAALATSITFEAYQLFPGVEFLAPGTHGPVYEVRTYQVRHAGLAATFDAWARVLEARMKISPLVAVMHALDGRVPRFMHLWPYASLNDRMAIRADAVQRGVWPPPGGLPHLDTMQSEIFLPASFSPLQ
jgi:hypothetical protein